MRTAGAVGAVAFLNSETHSHLVRRLDRKTIRKKDEEFSEENRMKETISNSSSEQTTKKRS